MPSVKRATGPATPKAPETTSDPDRLQGSGWLWKNLLLGILLWAGFEVIFGYIDLVGRINQRMYFLVGGLIGGVFGFFSFPRHSRFYKTVFGAVAGMFFVLLAWAISFWTVRPFFEFGRAEIIEPRMAWLVASVLVLTGAGEGILYTLLWSGTLWIFRKLGGWIGHPGAILFGISSGAFSGLLLIPLMRLISPHITPGGVLWSFFCYTGPRETVLFSILLSGFGYGIGYALGGRPLCWMIFEAPRPKFDFLMDRWALRWWKWLFLERSLDFCGNTFPDGL